MDHENLNPQELEDELLNDDDLFAEEEDLGIDLESGEFVKIATAGGGQQYIAWREGMTVSDVLAEGNIFVRAGHTDVYVDGQLSGNDTPVNAGATITTIGAVKGG